MITELVPEEYEEKYVHKTYSAIAESFSKTRYKIWPCVSQFINSIPIDETILEIGCGNGKNMIRPTTMTGIDMCDTFVDICKSKGLNVIHGDALNLPFDDNTFGNALCVAVIHHLSTKERRSKVIEEAIRVTKPNGLIFISVWLEHDDYKGDSIVEFHKKSRYYYLFKHDELVEMVENIVSQQLIKTFVEAGNEIVILRKQ
jgi:tRNA (uracil-5-)-methyltransferase TRM9